MRITATAAMLLFSVALHGQISNEIKNIDYYNSLKWKNSASLEVYIDKTYKLPGKIEKASSLSSSGAIIPYRNWYPYNYYNSGFYYTNGFNMGYNAVCYTPIRLWHRHRRHNR